MTLSLNDLKVVEEHWSVSALPKILRDKAQMMANDKLVERSVGHILSQEKSDIKFDVQLLEQVATGYELAAIEGLNSLLHPSQSEDSKQTQQIAKAGAFKAFELLRVLPIPTETDHRIFHVLHLAGLAYVGERWTDLKRWFNDEPSTTKIPSVENTEWDKRLLYRLYECWVRLLRKDSWEDLEQISPIIISLRNDQKEYESLLMENTEGGSTQATALRLIALYHLAKATERLALYMLQGEPVSISAELDQHFEAALKACSASRDSQFEMILSWLHVSSKKMASGSLWWVAHTVNSRVTRFVSNMTKHRGLFELLPPQRSALQEQGLLDQANRAVIVDMPTSGGKTQLAQFRMLQALNQFAQDDGWVAYIAPTRALVSQITRRLRADFEPLGIHVEQLTGAIEVDSFEDALLQEQESFQVLVLTPEKLQLIIRNKKIQRPLSLVVMDEAHNIEDQERGLRIELLLATIKQEARIANFLLLMPFVPNAKDLAQWLAADQGRAISLGTSAWQPNERIIGMFDIHKSAKRGDWNLSFETLTTTQRTINLSNIHKVGDNRPLSQLTHSQANTLSAQAVAMAKVFSKRGTSIAVAQKIPDVWSIARKVSDALPSLDNHNEDIALVQRFLSTEISPDFELIGMLSKGVAVHHAGLPSEALSLIEWLTESGLIKVLCATTTIAQGLNFPVSSVFLASTKYPYGISMSPRAFWNLAGRAGRIGHDSVGVVGIAAGSDPNSIREFVSKATGDLISRLEILLNELQEAGELSNLTTVIMEDQWTDYRSYIAHLWNEKQNLDVVISEAETTLRNTYGFGVLRSKNDNNSNLKADALLDATRSYIRNLAEHPENSTLADATGFSPEGARSALLELKNLENQLTMDDWSPNSLFSDPTNSALPDLMGIMTRLPQLKNGLEDLKGEGVRQKKLADITQDWVSGKSLADIANSHFSGKSLTDKLSKACKAVYRDLANNGAWGLSALSKMPTSGLDFESMSDEDKRKLNNLPAMLYHGVKTEEGVLMRMNSVPRTIAEAAGSDFKKQLQENTNPIEASKHVVEYLKNLSTERWEDIKPNETNLSGKDYQKIWKQLSGL